MQKFEINDLVTVVNYGKIKHIPKNQTKERPECVVCEGSVFYCVDVMPELVGKSGTVKDVSVDDNTNLVSYTVDIEHPEYGMLVLEEEQLKEADDFIHFDLDLLDDIRIRNIVVCFTKESVVDLPYTEIIQRYKSFVTRLNKR